MTEKPTGKMDESNHILVVDDDTEIASLIADFLRPRGYRVSLAANTQEARKLMGTWPIDLLVLDIMMPGEDGLSLCREIRESSQVPIIMLTAVSGDSDRIVGLEMGADDYLEKPFNPRELLARMKAVLRRSGGAEGAAPESEAAHLRFCFEGWVLDEGARELRSPGNLLINLSTGEFQMLKALLEQPREVLSRDDLLASVKGSPIQGFGRSVDIQISRLRRKLADHGLALSAIKTVRGEGYLFSLPVERERSE